VSTTPVCRVTHGCARRSRPAWYVDFAGISSPVAAARDPNSTLYTHRAATVPPSVCRVVAVVRVGELGRAVSTRQSGTRQNIYVPAENGVRTTCVRSVITCMSLRRCTPDVRNHATCSPGFGWYVASGLPAK